MSTDYAHNPHLFGISEDLQSLIFSKLSNVSDLNALSRTNRTFRNVLQKRMRALQRAALLTYGAAALRNRPQKNYSAVFDPLTAILKADPPSDDAKLVVARTFSGARVDESVTLEDLYPEEWANIRSFCLVRDWWKRMCKDHLAVALTTDVLAFLLFSAEAFLSRNPTSKSGPGNFQLISNAAQLSITLESKPSNADLFVAGRDILHNTFRQSYTCSFNTLNEAVLFTCRMTIGNRISKFELQHDALPTDLTVKTWAQSFLGKIASARDGTSLHHPELHRPGLLQRLHLNSHKSFRRAGVSRPNKLVLF